MLDGNVEALLLLNTTGDGSGHQAGQPGILGEVLEVAAAKRIAVDVDGRCQPVGAAVFLHFPVNSSTHLVHQLRVPGLCQSVCHGERGGILVDDGILLRIAGHKLLDKAGEGLEDGQSQINGLDLTLCVNGTALLDAKTGRAVTQGHVC